MRSINTGEYTIRTKCGEQITITVITQQMGRAAYCIPEIGHMPVGLCRIEIDPGNGRWWLAVAVLDRFQHKGIGSAIVRKMLALADLNGNDETWITCPKSLVKWYERLGFEYEYDSTLKMADGQISMSRSLTSSDIKSNITKSKEDEL
jgi:GNAT superfamily N-acetyltransferase